MRLVDLTHVIEHQMITYPGLPGPEIGEHLGSDASACPYATGTEFAIGQISMVANTGTYIDTPAHRFRGGHDLADLSLEHCVQLPAVAVDGEGAIGSIDSVNIDDAAGGQRPAHTILLAVEIPIGEHLTGLVGLPAVGALFTAVPPAIHTLASFLVCAFATLP